MSLSGWFNLRGTELDQVYLAVFVAAPIPRKPLASEKVYKSMGSSGRVNEAARLPCWQDSFDAQRDVAMRRGDFSNKSIDVEKADIFLSLVVPAYNEQDRLVGMLDEAVDYLRRHYSGGHGSENGATVPKDASVERTTKGRRKVTNGPAGAVASTSMAKGWEVLIVSDGSTDKTAETALAFARDNQLYERLDAKLDSGAPGSGQTNDGSYGTIRVVSLRENRGKGGAVVHGMRHVRGQYVIFADADGASKFEDLGKLIHACQNVEDAEGRGVAVGSRAHLVGSEAVVKVRCAPFDFMYFGVLTYVKHSVLSFVTFSCTPSICSFAFSHPLRLQPSRTHSVALNSSLAHRYHI